MLQIQDLLAFFHKINSNLKYDFQMYFKEMKNFYLGAALGIAQGVQMNPLSWQKIKSPIIYFFI